MVLSEAARTKSKEVEHHISTFAEILRKGIENIEKMLNKRRESLISQMMESVRHSEQTLLIIKTKASRYENPFSVVQSLVRLNIA